MPDDFKPQPDEVKMSQGAAVFGNVPPASEAFRKVPHDAESFGNLPNRAEAFRTVPPDAETPLPPPNWRESYTLTVREATRLFEVAGVARSERSIVNWCQRNRQGIARLDAYFDPNERRYFITRQSVDTAIAEEKARAAKVNVEPLPHPAENFGKESKPDEAAFRKVPNRSEGDPSEAKADANELAELKKENLDLKIANRAKDYFVEQLQKEREGLLQQVVDSSRRVGQLETKLLQLGEAPRANGSDQNELTA